MKGTWAAAISVVGLSFFGRLVARDKGPIVVTLIM